MARATVTVRELKNKETGIDLSVTSYKETKGMLGSSYEYQVMVVSNLSYFKSAKHQEKDNVQFTVMKKLQDFEEIHSKFNTKYSGTTFPQLPKKVLMMNESIAKARRNNLDEFVKYLASTSKLCTDPILLEFLGVSAMKAGKLKKMEVSESKVNNDVNNQNEQGDTSKPESGNADVDYNEENGNIFDDDDDDNNNDDNDLFGAEDISADDNLKGNLKIFDESVLSEALEDDEGDGLFITGSKSEDKVSSLQPGEDNENSNDDLSVDDDLDKIMTMSLKPEEKESVKRDTADCKLNVTDSETKAEEKEKIPISQPETYISAGEPLFVNTTDNDSLTTVTDSSLKGRTKPKPALRKKPDIRNKPDLNHKPGLKPKPVASPRKQNIPTKPKIHTKSEIPNNPELPNKPEIPNKPKLPSKAGVTNISDVNKTNLSDNVSDKQKDTSAAVEITEDDIMKYIQENTHDGDDDLDLFT